MENKIPHFGVNEDSQYLLHDVVSCQNCWFVYELSFVLFAEDIR
jgi:hypothetical protein